MRRRLIGRIASEYIGQHFSEKNLGVRKGGVGCGAFPNLLKGGKRNGVGGGMWGVFLVRLDSASMGEKRGGGGGLNKPTGRPTWGPVRPLFHT